MQLHTKANCQWPSANCCFFAHHGDLSGGDVLHKNAAFFRTHSSPREAAVTGSETRAHRPQGCRPFWVSPRSCCLTTAGFAGAAPVKTNLTLDETETKVNCYFSLLSKPFLPLEVEQRGHGGYDHQANGIPGSMRILLPGQWQVHAEKTGNNHQRQRHGAPDG
jgi:hypothetical protein